MGRPQKNKNCKKQTNNPTDKQKYNQCATSQLKTTAVFAYKVNTGKQTIKQILQKS